MRNATIAAIIYEFLFEVYRKIEMDRENGWLHSYPDADGIMREAFNHEYTSQWEWTAEPLEAIGFIKVLPTNSRLRGPFFHPLVSLEECTNADFSDYESFDNYSILMFSLDQVLNEWPVGSLLFFDRSPRFREDVAMKDDIFLVDGDSIKFDRARYNQKVMAHKRGMKRSELVRIQK